MYLLNNLTSNAKQKLTWITPNGEEVQLYFEFRANQIGWFIGIKYNDYDFSNVRLTTNFNLLRHYNSYLPFGLMCMTNDGFEPMNKDDFSNGYAKIYMLTLEECKLIEDKQYAKI